MSFITRIFLYFLIFIPIRAISEPWNLPKSLTTTNAKINFEVDTTWHMVHGTVNEVRGELSLSDPNRYDSIIGTITIPVAGLDTDNNSRDETMRESMHSDKFPNIQFKVNSVQKVCDPNSLSKGASCPFVLVGGLTIRDITQNVILEGQVTFNGSDYIIIGETNIKWQEYGIEDPSIFIAAVYPDTKIKVELKL